MRRELVKQLQDEFWFIPKHNPLFRRDLEVDMFIDTDDGWYDLIHELCTKLNILIGTKYPEFKNPDPYAFQVVQLKEKFGGLRFYVGPGNDEIFSLIHEYEEKSYSVCEVCGKAGQLRTKAGWLKTLCSSCAKDLGYASKVIQ